MQPNMFQQSLQKLQSSLQLICRNQPCGEAYFLPCQQKVLVHVRAQEACVAVAFHQLIDVVLN